MRTYSFFISVKEKGIKVMETSLDILLKPFRQYYTDEKEDERYYRKIEKMPQDKAVKLVAKRLMKYVVSCKGREVRIHVAKSVDTEMVGGISISYIPFGLLKGREITAKNRLDLSDLDMQEKVIDKMRETEGIEVRKEKEDVHEWNCEDYKHTYYVSYK